MKTTIIQPYDRKIHKGITFTDPSMTKQEHKDECNIYVILKQFNATGMTTHIRTVEGQFDDFQDLSFHEAMNMITEAQTSFNELPSELRKVFNNDAGNYVEFVTNPENTEAMYEIGLAERPADYQSSEVHQGQKTNSTPPASPKPPPTPPMDVETNA